MVLVASSMRESREIGGGTYPDYRKNHPNAKGKLPGKSFHAERPNAISRVTRGNLPGSTFGSVASTAARSRLRRLI